MSHSRTIRRRTHATATTRQPDRVAAGAQAAAQGPAQVDPLAVAIAAGPARPPLGRRRSAAGPSAGTARRAPPASRASNRLTRSSSSSLATIGTGTSRSGARSADLGAGAGTLAGLACWAGPGPRRVSALAVGRSSGGAWRRWTSASISPPAGSVVPNTSANTALNALTWPGSDTNTLRAVQYSRRRDDRLDHCQSVGEPGRALRRHGDPGVVQPPRERRRPRRQVELDRLDPERTGASITGGHQLLEPGRPERPPGPRRT